MIMFSNFVESIAECVIDFINMILSKKGYSCVEYPFKLFMIY